MSHRVLLTLPSRAAVFRSTFPHSCRVPASRRNPIKMPSLAPRLPWSSILEVLPLLRAQPVPITALSPLPCPAHHSAHKPSSARSSTKRGCACCSAVGLSSRAHAAQSVLSRSFATKASFTEAPELPSEAARDGEDTGERLEEEENQSKSQERLSSAAAGVGLGAERLSSVVAVPLEAALRLTRVKTEQEAEESSGRAGTASSEASVEGQNGARVVQGLTGKQGTGPGKGGKAREAGDGLHDGAKEGGDGAGSRLGIGAFQHLPAVSPAYEILGTALRRAKLVRPTKGIVNASKKARNKGAKQIDALTKELAGPLGAYVRGFPRPQRLHPYEQAVLGLSLGPGGYEEVLCSVDALRKRILDVGKSYAALVNKTTTKKEAEEQTEKAFTQLEVLYTKRSHVVDALKEAAKMLRGLPVVRHDLPTLCLVGAPNVGKSSLVRVLSSGKPEVCNYPFTTRGISLGHLHVGQRRHQVTDTPGLLSRPDAQRNSIEMLTIAALSHLPTSILFVHDLTEECGTPAAQQLQLYRELKERFGDRPWLDVISKADLLGLDGSDRGRGGRGETGGADDGGRGGDVMPKGEEGGAAAVARGHSTCAPQEAEGEGGSRREGDAQRVEEGGNGSVGAGAAALGSSCEGRLSSPVRTIQVSSVAGEVVSAIGEQKPGVHGSSSPEEEESDALALDLHRYQVLGPPGAVPVSTHTGYGLDTLVHRVTSLLLSVRSAEDPEEASETNESGAHGSLGGALGRKDAESASWHAPAEPQTDKKLSKSDFYYPAFTPH